jgi:hypothetical protein
MASGSTPPPILDPAPDWVDPGNADDPSRSIVLWHGCTSDDYRNIVASGGIDPRVGRSNVDFGQGFYTTTRERQARHWAWERYFDAPLGTPGPVSPVTLRFRVPLVDLAPLDSLHFVLGDFDDERYWSLVQYCRQSPGGGPARHHHSPISGNWYDIVTGPVADFWRQRSTMRTGDQVSFHSGRSVAVLNALIFSGNPVDFVVAQVV